MSIIDFQKFIELCRKYNIGIELIVDDDIVNIALGFKTLIADHPLALLGSIVLTTPTPSPVLHELSSWIHSPDGLKPQVEAMLGFPVDDLNQSISIIMVSISLPNSYLLSDSSETNLTICLTASGPSSMIKFPGLNPIKTIFLYLPLAVVSYPL